MQNSSLFQQYLFTLYSKENFEYVYYNKLLYMQHSMHVFQKEIISQSSYIFPVSKVESYFEKLKKM